MSIVDGNAALRVLRFLFDSGPCTVTKMEAKKDSHILLSSGPGKRILASADTIHTLESNELLAERECELRITQIGKMRLKRAIAVSANDQQGFAGQHRNLERREIQFQNDVHSVTVNTEESPLARLHRRLDGHGRPWIDDAAFEAGERLRRDFTIGGLMQKVTASWDAAIGNSGGRAGAGDKVGITDSAIDARNRLEEAYAIVGSDLAGVLTDFCCYLKGLENIERERKWPPRSAKLMLRTGLDLLARFYGLKANGASSVVSRS